MRRSFILRTLYLSSSSVVSRAFSALCVYSKFGHHPHPLGYLCAKFNLFRALRCWGSTWRKIAYTQSINHSVTHPAYIWCPANRSFRFGECGLYDYKLAFVAWRVKQNVTGRHRGPKQKLRAGYRAPSLQRTSYLWDVRQVLFFIVECDIAPPGYPCANFRFCPALHCWASPWRKIAYLFTHSFNHPAYLIRPEPKLSLSNRHNFFYAISYQTRYYRLQTAKQKLFQTPSPPKYPFSIWHWGRWVCW